MRTFVLDTSLFVNPAAARVFGATPTEAFARFLEMAGRCKGVDFLMPPSIYQELMFFAEEHKISRAALMAVRLVPPKRHEVKIPGALVFDLVENFRDRLDRGLRLAERSVRDALLMPPPAPPAEGEKRVRPDAEVVSRLREAYRRIMREGMLDSRADVDLLLLAYEVGGTLVSADQGVLHWAETLGVAILPHDRLLALLG